MTNIGYVTAYGGNACMLTGSMSLEQATQGVNLNLTKADDYRTKIMDLKLDRADESASPQFMRELATYIAFMETDSVMGSVGDISNVKELMKQFTIKQDRASGTITLFDPKIPSAERDVYIFIRRSIRRPIRSRSMRMRTLFLKPFTRVGRNRIG